MVREAAYIRESSVERFLVDCVEAVEHNGFKGICEKHVSPGRRGAPDRLVTWPWGRMDLAELKAPKGRMAVHQERDHAKRSVYVWKLYTKLDVVSFVKLRCQKNSVDAPDIVTREYLKSYGV